MAKSNENTIASQIVQAAISDDPVKVSGLVSSEMRSQTVSAIDAVKAEVGANFFGGASED